MTSLATEHSRYSSSSLDAATLAEAFQQTATRCAGQPALRTRDGSQSLTWAQYNERVRSVAAGLAALGVARGDTVALMLSNRPEFQIVDSAAMHLGATPFSIYNTYPAEQAAHLLTNSASKVVVTERAALATVVEAARSAGVSHLVVIDGDGEGMTLSELEAGGSPDFDFEAAWRAVQPDDVLTIIYTSGTTGPPKGVELTHANMLGTLRSYAQVIDFPDEGRVISWLPMAHIAERACSHYLPIAWGYEATCVADTREVIAALPEVRPTWFFAVPRIWEKLKAALQAKGIADPAALPDEAKAAVRRDLGLDQASSINVGAAPTPVEVIEFFHALGIPLAELWGMSESCASGAINPPNRIKIGTVGPALPGFELKLAGDGEILLRGPGVMAGYRGEPDKTREVLDQDGWLSTGDIGVLDEDGYLTIVDRKKELIINAAGKNMSPANIESALKTACPLIGYAVTIGDSRPYNVALLTLDPDATRALATRLGLPSGSLGDLAASKAVRDAVAEGVELANTKLARVEQIKRFELLGADWQPGGDELTPTSKLKRKPIAEKYAAEVEALYASGGG